MRRPGRPSSPAWSEADPLRAPGLKVGVEHRVRSEKLDLMEGGPSARIGG